MAGDSAKEVEIGEVIPDGTIYAGVSPETGKAMFTTATDAPATCTFDEAQEYAAKLDAHGHRDWRVPTKNEIEGNAEWANPGHGGWRCADESDSDPYRQRRLNAAFVRADSSRPVSSAEAQRLTARAGGGLCSPDGVNPFPPKGEPKRGGPS